MTFGPSNERGRGRTDYHAGRILIGAVHKVRHAIFGQFLPLPCHTSSHIPGPPESTSHISDPPISRRPSTTNPDKSPLVHILFQLFAEVFCRGFCQGGLWSGRFCPGWLLIVRSRSVTIHLLHQKVKHHFKFHVSYVRYKNLEV